MWKPRIPCWVSRFGRAKTSLRGEPLLLRGGDRVARDDRALDEALEPRPRHPAVGRLGDRLVDEVRLLEGQVAGATGDVTRIRRLDLERLDTCPQPGQAQDDVEGVGDER